VVIPAEANIVTEAAARVLAGESLYITPAEQGIAELAQLFADGQLSPLAWRVVRAGIAALEASSEFGQFPTPSSKRSARTVASHACNGSANASSAFSPAPSSTPHPSVAPPSTTVESNLSGGPR
jgi:hypothetical protein